MSGRAPGPRLYVIALSSQYFTDWCIEHGLSPRDPSLVAVLPGSWERRLQGTDRIRYVVLPWTDASPRFDGLMGWLSTREAQARAREMTPAELAAWIQEQKASIA